MENTQDRENKNKKLLILALLIALLACSFGFAAYSRSIDLINEYRDENYVVYRGGVLSINPDKPENGTVKPSSYGGADAEPAELTENGIININVHFTKPGQSATYSFYGVNKTKVNSYLNRVVFGDKYCTPKDDAIAEDVEQACDDIVFSINVNNDMFYNTVGIIDNHMLKADSNEPISVTIKYLEGAKKIQGGFNVDFGDSFITYSDVD